MGIEVILIAAGTGVEGDRGLTDESSVKDDTRLHFSIFFFDPNNILFFIKNP